MICGKKVIVFVAASGSGSRMQMNIPKQFVSIYDMPLFIYPMAKIQANGRVDEIALAVPPGWNEYAKSITQHFGISKLKYIVNGGCNLPTSMRNMLDAVNRSNKSYVAAMMDGNRIICDDVIDSVLDNYEKFGTTIPYFNPYEAAFYMDNGSDTDLVRNELDRKKIFLISPPIVYPSEVVNEAMKYAVENGLQDKYLHQLVIELGHQVSFVKCSPYNIKVTEPGDIEIVKSLLRQSSV